jgi:hypothetical protein
MRDAGIGSGIADAPVGLRIMGIRKSTLKEMAQNKENWDGIG